MYNINNVSDQIRSNYGKIGREIRSQCPALLDNRQDHLHAKQRTILPPIKIRKITERVRPSQTNRKSHIALRVKKPRKETRTKEVKKPLHLRGTHCEVKGVQ